MVIEVTRQCLLRCQHCLRGDAEDDGLCYDAEFNIARLLARHDWCGHLTLSGGDPFLKPKRISMIAKRLQGNHISLSGFYIATSGEFPTYHINDIVSCLLELYGMCLDRDEMTCVQFSDDPYREVSKLALENYETLSGFLKIVDKRNGKIPNIINEGRAKDLELSKLIARDLYEPEIEIDDGVQVIRPETLYFNVHGECFPDCDLSYETQSALNGPSVNDSDFEEQLIDDLMDYHSGRKSVCKASYGEDYERQDRVFI